MTTQPTGCRIFPFPETRRWSGIAQKFVDYALRGDPRAAYFYLEYELSQLKVSRLPTGLKKEIEKEFKKRGFSGQIPFC